MDAEQYIDTCVAPLKPKVILLHFGEEELTNSKKTVDEMIESYRWLLYQLHTALPESRLVLVAVNEELSGAGQYNRRLKQLSKEYGCEYSNGPAGNQDESYTVFSDSAFLLL